MSSAVPEPNASAEYNGGLQKLMMAEGLSNQRPGRGAAAVDGVPTDISEIRRLVTQRGDAEMAIIQHRTLCAPCKMAGGPERRFGDDFCAESVAAGHVAFRAQR
jgi:hypothetical protein